MLPKPFSAVRHHKWVLWSNLAQQSAPDEAYKVMKNHNGVLIQLSEQVLQRTASMLQRDLVLGGNTYIYITTKLATDSTGQMGLMSKRTNQANRLRCT